MPESETWTAPARTAQQIRGACYASVKAKVAKRIQRRALAQDTLRAAEERLRVVQELGDPATILQAMKDRDTAAAALARAESKTADPKRLYTECKLSAATEDTRVRLEQMKAEREEEDRRAAAKAAEEQAEAEEAAEDGKAFLRVIGAAAQGAANALQDPSPAPALSTPAPLATPVEKCSQCIQQWCSYQCSGFGDTCAPCMKRWCDFEC